MLYFKNNQQYSGIVTKNNYKIKQKVGNYVTQIQDDQIRGGGYYCDPFEINDTDIQDKKGQIQPKITPIKFLERAGHFSIINFLLQN